METFTEYCKDYVKEHLNEFEGQTISTPDIAYRITEGANSDGTLTYSASEAKEYIREWWNDCGAFWVHK